MVPKNDLLGWPLTAYRDHWDGKGTKNPSFIGQEGKAKKQKGAFLS